MTNASTAARVNGQNDYSKPGDYTRPITTVAIACTYKANSISGAQMFNTFIAHDPHAPMIYSNFILDATYTPQTARRVLRKN